MKCKNCENENNEGAKYCSKCGENLEFQKDKKSSDKKLMIILSVIIAIIIILILVIALIFNSIKISFSDGSSQIAHLSDDNTGYQTIDLGRSVDTDYITLTIDSVYSGYKYDDTCIAEVVVLGY